MHVQGGAHRFDIMTAKMIIDATRPMKRPWATRLDVPADAHRPHADWTLVQLISNSSVCLHTSAREQVFMLVGDR